MKSYCKMESTWKNLAKKPDFPALDESFETDICVIGGGLCGVLTAYLLAKSGKRVAILEKKQVGSGATGLTTAFLTASIDTDFSDLIRLYGPEDSKKIIASHMRGIDLIEKIARDENIDCEFQRCSNHIFAAKEKGFSDVEEEHDAALELGLDVKLERDGSRIGFPNHGFCEIKNQAKFHPLKFLYGLLERIRGPEVRIFEHTEAIDIEKRDFGSSVKANGHSVQAKHVVSATYSPFNQPLKLYFKKGMYQTFVIEAHTDWKIKEGTYEDTDNPYHYFRIDLDGRGYRIMVGGEDMREDLRPDEQSHLDELRSFLESVIPKESFTMLEKWSGPILEPVDGLAFIGPLARNENVAYAFGFSGNGMTYSAIAAIMIKDHIDKKPNPWQEIYRADRIPRPRSLMTKGKDFTEELVRGVVRGAIRKKTRNKHGGADSGGESGRMGEWKQGLKP